MIDRFSEVLKHLEERKHKLEVIQKEMSASVQIIEPLEQVLSQVELLVECAPPVTMETQRVEDHLEKMKVECLLV